MLTYPVTLIRHVLSAPSLLTGLRT